MIKIPAWNLCLALTETQFRSPASQAALSSFIFFNSLASYAATSSCTFLLLGSVSAPSDGLSPPSLDASVPPAPSGLGPPSPSRFLFLRVDSCSRSEPTSGGGGLRGVLKRMSPRDGSHRWSGPVIWIRLTDSPMVRLRRVETGIPSQRLPVCPFRIPLGLGYLRANGILSRIDRQSPQCLLQHAGAMLCPGEFALHKLQLLAGGFLLIRASHKPEY
ncbi:hypothetical protein PspLS_09546 [Pyricularia sp. CBS 133598]|nr:hypothetical protein PspLS_09546 [Pyricularia sp. CBS 133598]